ncbi:MAG: hypothetical protein JW845_06650 [Dehalococcoidales bacterium]|nr:hypothetical protein [Dehalococcoidales bacterium]
MSPAFGSLFKSLFSSWEHIGRISYGNIEGNIPHWVLSSINRIEHKYGGGSSGLVDRIFYLKGKHFKYRIFFSGQGGPVVDVERRKR